MTSQRPVEELAADIASQISNAGSRTVPELRVLRRDASKLLHTETPERVLAVVLRLLEDAGTPRWYCYEIASQDRRVSALFTPHVVRRLGHGMSTWVDVDSFGTLIAGPAWRNGMLASENLLEWTKSSDRWWRRAALVSTVALNNTARGGKGDAQRTLRVCTELAADRDDMVVKAMSWALRELAKKDPSSVAQFLAERELTLAPRVIREVQNKLKTGLKSPKRHGAPGG